MDDLRPRSARRHRFLVALPLVAIAVAMVTTLSAGVVDRLALDVWMAAGGMIVFTTVGALIEDRRPGQVVGRICLTVGVLFVASGLLRVVAVALDSLPGRVPTLGAALAVIASVMFTLALLLSGPLLLSRFPDGRKPGRSAILGDGLLAATGAIMLTGAVRPGPLEYDWIEPVDNPLGVTGIAILSDDVFAVALLAYGLTLVLAGFGLSRRYARGSSVVRAQIRWFGAAISISIMLLVLLFVGLSGDEAINNTVWGAWILSLLLPPIAIGVAILRYRLYDIDRVISRTISYGLVTALLVMVFLLVNLGLQWLLSSVTSADSLAVAGSTLLAAALFTPVRRRVQRIVDRRFDRARYDGERTADAFSARMRDAIDLPTVTYDLDATVRRAIAPSRVGLWLRGGDR